MKTLLALGLALAATPVLAATYHVAPSGSDAGLCAAAAPCREIRRALTLAGPGDTVLVADGTYKGFDVDNRHGQPGLPITVRAAGPAAEVVKTTDRGDNRDTIFVTFSSWIVLDGLRSFAANRAAVRIDQSHHVTVRNGVFGNNGTWGIFTDFSDDVTIENNETYGSVNEHGIYHSNSGDRPVIRGNRSHDNRGAGIHVNADASQGGDGVISGGLFENNVLYGNGRGGGSAINMDGVQDTVIRNNVIFDNHATGIGLYRIDGLQGPRGNQVLHNTVDQAADGRWALLVTNTSGPNFVRNNILYNRHSFRGGIAYGSAADAAGTDSDHNVLDRVSSDGGNTVVSLAAWQAQGREPHSLSAPLASLFVDVALRDYHLSAASPALDRGQTLASVAVDIEGQARPAGAASDIGADERAGGPPPPPPPPLPTLSIGDVTLAEGNAGTFSAVLVVSLSAASTQPVGVGWATANGTATAGSDYAGASGTLTFAPGVTSRTIAVAVTGDTAGEADETFFVNLAGPSGATLADGQGRATITNDDTAPAEMVSPVPGTRLPGTTVTFAWTPGFGVSEYWLRIGNNQGGGGIHNASAGTQLSVTVSGLPRNGRVLWVRVRSRIGGTWQFRDYQYTAMQR